MVWYGIVWYGMVWYVMVCLHVCMYIYIYVCVDVYIYICVCIHTHNQQTWEFYHQTMEAMRVWTGPIRWGCPQTRWLQFIPQRHLGFMDVHSPKYVTYGAYGY